MANRRIAPGTALYLYGISKSFGAKPGKIAAAGIDGVHAVQSLACGEFICWFSAVDRDSFSDAINSNMENLEWLALHGVRHQQVVADVFAGHTLIPARFGTVFSGEQALIKNVQERKPVLEKVFTRISGAEEWGVKIFAEQAPAAPVARQVRSGKDYR